MNRRTFLMNGGALPMLAARSQRPNILFVMADEWRAQATRFNGDGNVATPVLDRFMRESICFDGAISGTPVCCPARASVMTGQYPLTHGVFINDVELKPNAPTLAETLRSAGYGTGFIGKWHLYGSPDGNYGRRLSYIPADKRLGFDYWKACECSHEYNHSLYYEGNDRTPRYWPGYDAEAQTDDACRFLDGRKSSPDPFFLFLSWGPPHFPYPTAPEKYRAAYASRDIELRANVPAAYRDGATKILRGYYAHMAALDDCFGRLLANLERNGMARDTIVVFTSDHGDMMLSQGLTTKLYPWDESIRIPLLVRYPRRFGAQGRRVSTPVNMPDLMPTLLGLAGVGVPDDVQGRDCFGVGKQPASALIGLPVPITEARRYGFAAYRGVHSERYTYVRSVDGPWLLYDNRKDPYQKKNLIASSAHAVVRSTLERELRGHLQRTGDEFLPALTYLKRAGLQHYKEANVAVGHTRSPWGDWESTLTQ